MLPFFARVAFAGLVVSNAFAFVSRAAASPAAASLEAARARAAQIAPAIAAAVGPERRWPPPGGAAAPRPNAALAAYAGAPAASAEGESFAEAARRILAKGTTTKRRPEATSQWLDATADAILAALPAADADDATRDELKRSALVARFHAKRMMAAIRYNLFLRGLSLAELLAATYTERDAVALWREIVALTPEPALQARARDELKQLEHNLKELEEQCCPPDEATLAAKIWMPPAEPAPGATAAATEGGAAR